MHRILAATLLAACTGEGPVDSDAPVDGLSCEGDVCVVSGTLLEDTTFTADRQWLLRGGVFIGDDENPTTLTIEPGTTVFGESSTDGMLVVRRHSRLVADGTAEAPIVFTSSKAEGTRARGDWGGLIVNGRAPINSCDDPTVTCEAFGEGGTGWYGGTDADDDSGVLRYVRIEYAGTLVSPDNELNGLGLQGVGRGTTLEYIQVHMNADDGIEFFGGTANLRYALVTGVGDDGFDWTDGWTGNAQFLVAQQYEDAGDNGIEADNNAELNTAEPRSLPTLSHVTLIGSPTAQTSDLGLLLREGTGARLSNVIVDGFNEACLDVDHGATFDLAGTDLTLDRFRMDCAVGLLVEEDDASPTALQDLWDGGADNQLVSAGLVDPRGATPDYTGTAVTGGQSPSDAWFEAASFVGGVDPARDWTAGWTTHTRN